MENSRSIVFPDLTEDENDDHVEEYEKGSKQKTVENSYPPLWFIIIASLFIIIASLCVNAIITMLILVGIAVL